MYNLISKLRNYNMEIKLMIDQILDYCDVPQLFTASDNLYGNVTRNREMSLEKSFELSDEDLKISLNNVLVSEKVISKKHKRQQGIIGLIRKNPRITVDEMAEKLDVNERTIHRDIEELKNVIEHVGPTKSGYWMIKK